MSDTVLITLTDGQTFAGTVAVNSDATRIAYGANNSVSPADDGVYVANIDGTNITQILSGTVYAYPALSWSPSGTTLIGSAGGDLSLGIYKFSSTGTGLTQIRTTGNLPTYSPDGTKIAFVDNGSTQLAIYTMNADGTGATKIYEPVAHDATFPVWGVDNKILFSQTDGADLHIWRMDPDGSNKVQLTSDPGVTDIPNSLSSSETKILFTRFAGGLYIMNYDGSGIVNVNAQTNPTFKPNTFSFFYTAQVGEVVDTLIITTLTVGLGITFALFNNDNLVDWSKELGTDETEGYDFDSYFVSGYKLRGEGIRKFQSNYVELWNNVVDTECSYTFTGLFDYASTNLSGRWTQQQTVDMAVGNFSRRAKRLKVRGHGKVLQFRVDSVLRKMFNIEGWATFDTANTRP